MAQGFSYLWTVSCLTNHLKNEAFANFGVPSTAIPGKLTCHRTMKINIMRFRCLRFVRVVSIILVACVLLLETTTPAFAAVKPTVDAPQGPVIVDSASQAALLLTGTALVGDDGRVTVVTVLFGGVPVIATVDRRNTTATALNASVTVPSSLAKSGTTDSVTVTTNGGTSDARTFIFAVKPTLDAPTGTVTIRGPAVCFFTTVQVA
jgi:hypothetical protein